MKGADKSIRSNLTVSEVVGILDPSSIRDGLKEECGAQIIEIDGSSECCSDVEASCNSGLTMIPRWIILHENREGTTSVGCDISRSSFDETSGSTAHRQWCALISITDASPKLTELLFTTDAFLADIIDQLPSSKFSLVYVTSPREYMEEGKSNPGFYDAINDGVQEPFHMELKRDYAGYSRQDDSDNNKSLFERYQFLSPGSFRKAAL